jgi:hypothetical protein
MKACHREMKNLVPAPPSAPPLAAGDYLRKGSGRGSFTLPRPRLEELTIGLEGKQRPHADKRPGFHIFLV